MATEKRLIDANAPRIEKHFSKRLVDAYALMDTIEEITWYHVNAAGRLVKGANSSHDIPLYKANDIFSALGSARTVDAVEVVRCKDCKNRDELTGECKHPRAVGWDVIIPEDDDFCSYGKNDGA